MKSLFSAIFVISIFLPSQKAAAHPDAEPLWAMSINELKQLEAQIERHRLELISALNAASQAGVAVADLTRPYRFDSDKEVVNIPRSILNRVIIASLNLETESARLYLFCDKRCDRSLFNDLIDQSDLTPAQQTQTLTAMRGLWPKVKSTLAILWHDIPLGVWARLVHSKSYSRALLNSARYQAKAYGGPSMAAGAAGFGLAFGATEIAESMFMGPFHFVCQANYFWSVAFGTAIASLSRDVKTLFLFEKAGKPLFSRVMQIFASFKATRTSQRFEKRILFRALAGEDSIEIFEKMTKREAHSGALKHVLEQVSAKQAVAADSLLWAELAWELKNPALRKKSGVVFSESREKLFGVEITSLFSSDNSTVEHARTWQDVNASLKVILKTFRNGLDVQELIHKNRADAVKALGALDMQLRALDVFTNAWLAKRDASADRDANLAAAEWFRNVVSEWLSLAIEASGPDFKSSDFDNRSAKLKSLIDVSIRNGEPIDLVPAGVRSLHRSIEIKVPAARTCEAIFATAI